MKTRPSDGAARGRAPFRLLAFRAYSLPISCVVHRWFNAEWAAAGAVNKRSATGRLTSTLCPLPLKHQAFIAPLAGSSAATNPFAPSSVNLSYAYDKTDFFLSHLHLIKPDLNSQPYAYDSFAPQHRFPARPGSACPKLSCVYDNLLMASILPLALVPATPALSYASDRRASAADQRRVPDLGGSIMSYAYDKPVRRFGNPAIFTLAALHLSYAYGKINSASDLVQAVNLSRSVLSYAYDKKVGRFDEPAVFTLVAQDLSYAYDKFAIVSNLLHVPDRVPSDLSYAYDKPDGFACSELANSRLAPTTIGLPRLSAGYASAPPETGPPPPHIDRRRQIGSTPNKPATRRVFLYLGKTR